MEKVSEECGGRNKFEGGNKVFIFVSISIEVGLQLGRREWATIGSKLELRLHTIMQREYQDTIRVKVREEEFGETSRGTIMKVLDNGK